MCNTSREVALFADKEVNIEKIDDGIKNLSLYQSHSPLADILSSLLKDEEKVPILRPTLRDEPSPNFSDVSAFRPKYNWKPPSGHPFVELFLSKLESELFYFLPSKPQAYNLTKEELASHAKSCGRSIHNY